MTGNDSNKDHDINNIDKDVMHEEEKIVHIDRKTVNTIRCLAADMVQKANSGHPGLPLGMAPTTYLIYQRIMSHYSHHPDWINRDRFVLSAGHGSALLYSMLHLYDYGLTIADLQQFRQLDSLTPGHPEYGHTIGVEATTGPLGAGIAMAVGMAMAQKHLAAIFNKPDFPIIDNNIYVLGGDGCFMEGISSEALSLAGTLNLDNLIVLYDSNKISIEGSTSLAFEENVKGRMSAFGFDVFTVEDGDDLAAIEATFALAKKSPQPKFIEIKTTIAKGCPAKEGLDLAHGEPLGVENVKAMKRNFGFDESLDFQVDDDVYENTHSQIAWGKQAYENWQDLLMEYFESYPDLELLWNEYFNNDNQATIDSIPEYFTESFKDDATRNASGKALNLLKDYIGNLIGGSADLSPSTKTYLNNEGDFSKEDYGARNLHFGVREAAMVAIGNGMMLYGGLRVYVGTFLIFSDYFKAMARLSALMRVPLIYVLTHDSIGLGEDGPTHQPIEQLTMLRAMPNFNVFRPCDERETRVGWYLALSATTTPTALVLSRQKLPLISGSSKQALQGGYVISDCQGNPDVILMASGSEVALAMATKEKFDDLNIRVVSLPCLELFMEQPESYKQSVLPEQVSCRIAIEAGSKLSWGELVGCKGAFVTMDSFGASAPGEKLFERYGFTVANVVEKINKLRTDKQ